MRTLMVLGELLDESRARPSTADEAYGAIVALHLMRLAPEYAIALIAGIEGDPAGPGPQPEIAKDWMRDFMRRHPLTGDER